MAIEVSRTVYLIKRQSSAPLPDVSVIVDDTRSDVSRYSPDEFRRLCNGDAFLILNALTDVLPTETIDALLAQLIARNGHAR